MKKKIEFNEKVNGLIRRATLLYNLWIKEVNKNMHLWKEFDDPNTDRERRKEILRITEKSHEYNEAYQQTMQTIRKELNSHDYNLAYKEVHKKIKKTSFYELYMAYYGSSS